MGSAIGTVRLINAMGSGHSSELPLQEFDTVQSFLEREFAGDLDTLLIRVNSVKVALGSSLRPNDCITLTPTNQKVGV